MPTCKARRQQLIYNKKRNIYIYIYFRRKRKPWNWNSQSYWKNLTALSDVTLVITDNIGFLAHNCMLTMSSTEKCSYFDKGFCKLKEQCLKKHPTSDCQGECYDKKTCPSWHRVFDTVNKQTQNKISDIEKEVQRNSLLENRVKQLEKDNMELTTKLGTMYDKFDKTKEEIVPNEEALAPTIVIEKETISRHMIKFKCEICRRKFKKGNNLENHDKTCHILKGTNIYKCDNCSEKMENRSLLKQHINKEHITCSRCVKVFPTITSLNNHITAIHDKLKPKHDIERDPSLRVHKANKFDTN